ncbi:MAG: 3'-5' exonuclease [Ignavibacteria bacterium]|nr:3'-5' exonuclease [Ignavibacteria bacterium]
MEKLKFSELKDYLIIDIETVPQYKNFYELPDMMKEFWKKKMANQIEKGLSPEGLYERAGIYAEFGKIICICVGYFVINESEIGLRVKAFYGDDEKKLLEEFCELVQEHFSSEFNVLAGHNVKEFDFPYIARRCLLNNIIIPSILDTSGKKPWEVQHIDTMELWKFGDYKSFTSLDLLAYIFGIDSPKSEMDGSQVYSAYWEEGDIEKIKRYCMRDVATVAQLILRFRNMSLLKEENISFTN